MITIIILCCLVAQSCLTLCNPFDYSPSAFSVHGISQARILEWVPIVCIRFPNLFSLIFRISYLLLPNYFQIIFRTFSQMDTKVFLIWINHIKLGWFDNMVFLCQTIDFSSIYLIFNLLIKKYTVFIIWAMHPWLTFNPKYIIYLYYLILIDLFFFYLIHRQTFLEINFIICQL